MGGLGPVCHDRRRRVIVIFPLLLVSPPHGQALRFLTSDACSCCHARRRLKHGRTPYHGTAWTLKIFHSKKTKSIPESEQTVEYRAQLEDTSVRHPRRAEMARSSISEMDSSRIVVQPPCEMEARPQDEHNLARSGLHELEVPQARANYREV